MGGWYDSDGRQLSGISCKNRRELRDMRRQQVYRGLNRAVCGSFEVTILAA
jgi:hypothetical protein